MAAARHHEVMMDLVADKDYVLAFAKRRNFLQFLGAPDTAAGVMRRTQEKDSFIACQRRLKRLDIHVEPVVLDPKWR